MWDILTGKVLRTFRDLSEYDKLSYIIVHDKLLVSQNLTSEHYRKAFNKIEPASDQSFTDLVSTVKTTYGRWLLLEHVSD